MWKNKNNKIHIREADSTDEDELLGDLKVKNKITSFDIEHPNHRKKARRRSEALLEKEKLPPRQLDQREDDGTSLGMKWWETINPGREKSDGKKKKKKRKSHKKSREKKKSGALVDDLRLGPPPGPRPT